MRLTRLRAWNFKSFRELDIRLDPLNVVIGANASGKSNFVQLFAFIRDIAESGLENAISIQGGAQYLRNMSCEPDDKLAFELSIEAEVAETPLGRPSRLIRQTYRFSLAVTSGRRVSVAEDQLLVELDSTFTIKRVGDRYEIEGDSNAFTETLVSSLNSHRRSDAPQPLLIEEAILRSMPPLDGLKLIGVYDIDPKGPKGGVFLGAKTDLESNAENLAIALDKILSDSEHRRKLLNLLKDVLPFAAELETQQMQDSSFFFQMREKFSQALLPAAFLSDGTIDVVALIVILYFERKSLVVMEEPERNLHPSLISRVVEMLKDASRLKQIIVTTHNPEVVRYADPGQLILISRDASGSSHASRPADKAQVQRFLREEIGIQELYVENLLEA